MLLDFCALCIFSTTALAPVSTKPSASTWLSRAQASARLARAGPKMPVHPEHSSLAHNYAKPPARSRDSQCCAAIDSLDESPQPLTFMVLFSSGFSIGNGYHLSQSWQDFFNYTALHLAAGAGHVEVCRLLLKRGAVP